MNTFQRAEQFSRPQLSKQLAALLLLFFFILATWPQNLAADQQAPPPEQAEQAPPPGPNGEPPPPYAQQTPEQLDQLVAPIALYPDSLVAQILAASTFPEQVVEADRWVQANPNLKGDALGQAADQQPWDPSVKALTAFPTVLGNMDKNLSWTSSLGDAYYNQQQDVMNAVQTMRQRAEQAGTLKSTDQQTVANQDSDISIAPTNPDVVYVPAYDPWLVYGPPLIAWPGWYDYPGIWYGGPYLSFGLGFGVGFFGGFGWGWNHWGFDWHNHYPIYNHERYFSRSNTFYNRDNFYRGGGVRGGAFDNRGGFAGRGEAGNRGDFGSRGESFNRGATARPFNGNNQAARGYAEPRGQTGTRSGAFSGFGSGGQARSFSSRGSESFGGGFRGGGGGGFHGGGGGSHGGGRR